MLREQRVGLKTFNECKDSSVFLLRPDEDDETSIGTCGSSSITPASYSDGASRCCVREVWWDSWMDPGCLM